MILEDKRYNITQNQNGEHGM